MPYISSLLHRKRARNSSIIRLMAVVLKSVDELDRMRLAGRLAAEVLDFIAPYVKPGVTTGKLNDLCHDYMVNEQGTVPAPLNALASRSIPQRASPTSASQKRENTRPTGTLSGACRPRSSVSNPCAPRTVACSKSDAGAVC